MIIMKKLIAKLTRNYPQLRFTAADTFFWSPKEQTVYYDENQENKSAQWTLLHETAHGILGHTTYRSDLELLQLETDAWQKATTIAPGYDISIPSYFIQDCLDSYRDWLHARSTCPNCQSRSLQKDTRHYQCFNCKHVWKVTSSRLCRPYRLSVST